MINVEGNINSVEKQLLYDILIELKALREDLKVRDINIPFSDKPNLTVDYTSMKRAELIKLVGELKDRPKEYVKLSNKELIKLLER